MRGMKGVVGYIVVSYALNYPLVVRLMHHLESTGGLGECTPAEAAGLEWLLSPLTFPVFALVFVVKWTLVPLYHGCVWLFS